MKNIIFKNFRGKIFSDFFSDDQFFFHQMLQKPQKHEKHDFWEFSWQKFSIFFFRWPKKCFHQMLQKPQKHEKHDFWDFESFEILDRDFWIFRFAIIFELRKKKIRIIRFFWNFFYVFRSLWTFRKVYGLPMTKIFNISKNRFEVFQISDFRGFRRPSY